MWLSVGNHLHYIIIVLAIKSSQTVTGQYDFSRFFYPSPRNIASNFNSWRHHQHGNGIGSYVQPSSIKFSYSGDYTTVGDYCYTNDFTGLCQLTSKCPDIMRYIQQGINPVVCSYQTTEAVVCCPNRFTQPDLQVFNNNEYIQRDSSVNHNRNHPTQRPHQFYRPSPAPQSNKNNRQVVPHQQSGVRPSERKCEEYSRLSTHSSAFISLSISASTKKVNIPTCSYATGLIVGGEVAKTGEFPHMAAIGWLNNGEKEWKCGGSLMSEIFVLTAAHCSSLYGIPPDIVRLGDQNLVSDDDNAEPQEYQIANTIVHPNYKHSSNYYDIALIKLSREVIFTRFIRPACLWKNNLLNSTKAVATGWGQLEFAGNRSNDLRKVALNIIDNIHCQQLYERSKTLRIGIVRSQLCAGYLEGGKDTCYGDSGGPIQVITPRNQCIFHIVGVTSFGKACAAKNTAGVYTRVSSYLDWIEANVWP